jgi:autotransporter-associated beta strand protein
MMFIRRMLICLAVLGAFGALGSSSALAATHIWTGPSGGTWSNPANWNGGVPTNGESGGTIVQFGSGTTSTMDISGLVVDEIHFTGSGNTIGGTTPLGINGALLFDNVVSDAAGNSLATSLPIVLSGASTAVVSAAGTITIGGAVSGGVGLVFISSGGNFSMTAGNTGDSYTGSTFVQSGTLDIASANGVVISGPSLIVGGNGSAAQVVEFHQSSDISTGTAITVDQDGTLNLQGESDTALSLVVNQGSVLGGSLNLSGNLTIVDGSVALGSAGLLSASSLNMTGGTITGTGLSSLTLNAPGTITATSDASGSATISPKVILQASPTITVNPGTAPELRMTGGITQVNGTQGFTKAGTGTFLTSGANSYTGATTVSAGTLEANGTQTGPVTVAQNATLTGSGTVGAATIAGILAPVGSGMSTGSLVMQSTARLNQTITSTVPSVLATGTVTINPGAVLNLVVSQGIPLPHGSQVVLIGNDASDPISGQFGNLAAGAVITSPDGVPLTVNYAGGDGNDLTLVAGNVPPQAGPATATPNPATAGQHVAFSLTATDANQDPLTYTWDFGDGTAAGSGATVSHTFAAAGRYTVVATVSDGLAQAQSTVVVTVNTNGGAATTKTVTAYKASFHLTFPSQCVQTGAPFSVSLSAKRHGKAKGKVLQKVTKVVFGVAGGSSVSDKSAPFSAQLTAGPTATSGSTVMLTATASLTLHGGKHAVEHVTAPLKIC